MRLAKLVLIGLTVSILFMGCDSNVTVEASESQGRLVYYYNWVLWDASGNPNAAALKIAQSCQTYGNPQWLIIGNQATATFDGYAVPNTFIDAMHSYGLKVISHGHSFARQITLAHVKGQMDVQMSGGSRIDGFEIDETDPSGSSTNLAYYQALADYWRSIAPGTLLGMNFGGRDISDAMAAIPDFANTESCYWYFSQHGGVGETDFYVHSGSLIEKYPTKFLGLTSNWYIWARCYPSGVAYNSAYIMSPSYGRTYPIVLDQAVNLVKEAWSEGIYNFGILWDNPPDAVPPSGFCNGFPTFWDDFLLALSSSTYNPTPTPSVPSGGGGSGGGSYPPAASPTPTVGPVNDDVVTNDFSAVPAFLVVAFLVLVTKKQKRSRR